MTVLDLSEKWRDVVGWEGYYEISSLGRLRRSGGGRGTYPGKEVTGYLDRKGYRRTTLTRPGGKQAKAAFHVLVAEAFIGPKPAGKRLVRHLNGDKSDNTVGNLAWGTDKENAGDEIRLGRLKDRRNPNREKTHCPRSHEYTESNTRVDRQGRRFCRECRRENWHFSSALQDDDARHGTVNGYANGKCRCDPCKAAYSTSRKRKKNFDHEGPLSGFGGSTSLSREPDNVV